MFNIMLTQMFVLQGSFSILYMAFELNVKVKLLNYDYEASI